MIYPVVTHLLVTYFLNKRAASLSIFPSHMWADTSCIEITNACEFCASFYNKQPNIYLFLEILKNF